MHNNINKIYWQYSVTVYNCTSSRDTVRF